METRNRTTVWIVVAAIAGLLIGCLCGGLFAGAAGYALGRGAARGLEPQPYEYRDPGPIERMPVIPTPPAAPIAPDREPMPAFPMAPGAALVMQVAPESPAERAGVQAGDLVIALDGMPFEEMSLAEQLARYAPGDVVTLTIQRGGQELELDLRLGNHPERPGRPWIGIYYQELPSLRPERPAP